MDPVDALRQLEERLHTELMQNPSYVALLGVRRTIKDTIYLLEEKEAPPRIPATVRIRDRAFANSTAGVTAPPPSQADAAFAVLRENNVPLHISELVQQVRARGATVGGNNPEMNLSSSLSRDGRFGSMRYKGRPCWVVTGKGYASTESFEPVTESDRADLMGESSAESVDHSYSADDSAS